MHRVEFRGGPRAGEVVELADEPAALLPAEGGGRYRLAEDGTAYGFEIGYGPDESDSDEVHIRPRRARHRAGG